MIRRGLRTAGAPVRALEIGLIRLYRATLSGWLGGQCRFYPTCSHYAEDAIRETTAELSRMNDLLAVVTAPPIESARIHRVEVLLPQPRVTRILSLPYESYRACPRARPLPRSNAVALGRSHTGPSCAPAFASGWRTRHEADVFRDDLTIDVDAFRC